MTTTSDPLQEALRYTKLGWLIFPTKPDKTPYLSQYSATSDPALVRTCWEQYPDALIGCRVPEDQLILDVDPRHGGDLTWEKLLV